MKKQYILLGLSIVMMAAGLFNLTLDVDVKGHYFGNGAVFGAGLIIFINQVKKVRGS